MSREDENLLYVKYQYKGTYTTYRRCVHTPKDLCHREGENIPKFHYSEKSGHVKKDCSKRTNEKNQGTTRTQFFKCNYFNMNNKEENDFYKRKKSKKNLQTTSEKK